MDSLIGYKNDKLDTCQKVWLKIYVLPNRIHPGNTAYKKVGLWLQVKYSKIVLLKF